MPGTFRSIYLPFHTQNPLGVSETLEKMSKCWKVVLGCLAGHEVRI